LARLDTVKKTTGAQNYGADVKLPGMMNAAIKDCPVFGGKIKSFNAAAIANRPGVKKVVQVGDTGVAVIADTWWRAKTALDALPIDWDFGPNAQVSSDQIRETLKAGLTANDAVVGSSNGDAPAALANAARKIEAVYSYPYLSHAPLEPMNATAKWTPERCEVWVPTQNAEAALAATAEAAGLTVDKCDVYAEYLGGGFGRRARNDFVTQAVIIAKSMPGTAPRPKRSSGTKCMPNARRAGGGHAPTASAPKTMAWGWARVSSPDRAASSSRCPWPDTPAIPNTSPARSASPTPDKSTPKGSLRGRLKPDTCNNTGPGDRRWRTKVGGSLPIMRWLSDALLSWRGSHSPVTRPARSTVQRVHKARISCNLWLMYKMLQPSATSWRSTTNFQSWFPVHWKVRSE
jgi:hypothetical protein